MNHEEKLALMCSLTSYNEMVILPWGSMQEQKELIFFIKKCSHLAKKSWVLPKRFSLELGLLTHTSDNFWQLQLNLNSRSRCCWEASNRSGCLLIYIKMRCEAGTKLPLLISPIPQFLRKENPQVWARVTSHVSLQSRSNPHCFVSARLQQQLLSWNHISSIRSSNSK